MAFNDAKTSDDCKKLLNSKDSVLIVTIDEKEYLHLGCLLEEMFPEANIQMVTDVIHPSAVARTNQFSRVEEYIFFITIVASNNESELKILQRFRKDHLSELNSLTYLMEK